MDLEEGKHKGVEEGDMIGGKTRLTRRFGEGVT